MWLRIREKKNKSTTAVTTDRIWPTFLLTRKWSWWWRRKELPGHLCWMSRPESGHLTKSIQESTPIMPLESYNKFNWLIRYEIFKCYCKLSPLRTPLGRGFPNAGFKLVGARISGVRNKKNVISFEIYFGRQTTFLDVLTCYFLAHHLNLNNYAGDPNLVSGPITAEEN